MEIILSFTPTILVPIASYILYKGLRDLHHINWKEIGKASGLLVLACGFLAVIIFRAGTLAGFLSGYFATISALLSGLFLGIFLPQWRKLAGLLIGIGFPMVMFLSIIASDPISPDSIVRRNGEGIAQTLTKYHNDKGKYPETLEELIPTYISELKEPRHVWGWLYTADQNNFTLGYVTHVDNMGYSICKYSAIIPEWNCPRSYSTEPFYLEPTPTPEPIVP